MLRKNILAIIPARSGSKGIKNKNIYKINGKPLIYYTIKRAKKSKLITRLIVSTDSKKIKKICKTYNVDVPFLRPKKISGDNSNILETLIYCTKKLEGSKKFDYIVLLQPTSPLREKNEIDRCINKLIKSKCQSLISLTPLIEPHPVKLKIIKKGKVFPFLKKEKKDNPPRQTLQKVFKPSSNIYIISRDLLINKKKILSKNCTYDIIDNNKFLNIDDKSDLLLSKLLLKNFK